jgi:endoglucanase
LKRVFFVGAVMLIAPAFAGAAPTRFSISVDREDAKIITGTSLRTVRSKGAYQQQSQTSLLYRKKNEFFNPITSTRPRSQLNAMTDHVSSARIFPSFNDTPIPATPPAGEKSRRPPAPALNYDSLRPAVATAIRAKVRNPFGINLAGCTVSPSLCPNEDDIAWYTAPAQGFELFRLAFHDTTDKAAVYRTGNGLLAKGATVIFDRHDYKWPSVADQVAWWTAFAAPYKTNKHVILDLMNEPRGFTSANIWTQWAADTKAIIAGLRKNGVQNTIAVEWPGSSAAFRLDKSEPPYKACESAACAVDRQGGLGDGNILFSPHQYWDHGSSGTNPNCDPFFFLDKAREAAAKRGWKLLLGEGAFGSHLKVRDSCSPLLDRAITEIREHPETWFGVTWWGGGREWKESYIFKIEPIKGTRAGVPHSSYLDKLRGK